jgi:hypothetical protein
MKFNPYAMLLTTGALMLATVIFTQAGPTASLVEAGLAAVDSGFPQGSVLGANETPEAVVAHHRGTRVAWVDGAIAAGSDDGRALEE